MTQPDPMATLKSLGRNDQLFFGVGLVLLIVSFFHFAGLTEFGHSYNISVWNGIGLLAMLLFLAAVAIVAIQVFAPQVLPSQLPVTWNFIVLVAIALGALLVLIKALTSHASAGGISINLDTRIPAYILLVLFIVETGVAFLRVQAAGEAFPWQQGSGSATPPTPPAPPAA